LASLKKYTLPDQGWFRYIVCPHYTSECLIYVAMSLVTAPPGHLFNQTVLCGLVFVVVTIGVVAHGTKQWYADKFGADKVASRWKMIPLLF
jgi:3-oxo-5-alpha-steroid 4-dehydrogenase 3